MKELAKKKEAERRDFERELLFGEVGETVGALINELGITQRQLAERLELSESRMSRILGGTGNVTLKTLADVGAALGLRFHLTAEELPDRDQGPAADDGPLPKWLVPARSAKR
jgi:transcriptional regulator with XRE-family HTH domain